MLHVIPIDTRVSGIWLQEGSEDSLRIPVNSATQSDSCRPPREAVGGRGATDAFVSDRPLFTSFPVIVEQSISVANSELFAVALRSGCPCASP